MVRFVVAAAPGAAVPPGAGVAQLVEQLIRNQQVAGSSPIAGSNFPQQFSRVSSRLAARPTV
jgi:hypothetical protein